MYKALVLVLTTLGLMGCVTASQSRTPTIPMPTKYLELSSGYEAEVGQSGKAECYQPEEFFCIPLPSGRSLAFPKSEAHAQEFAAASLQGENNGSAGNWQASELMYFISEITDYDLLGFDGPFYHVSLVVFRDGQITQFLETAIFSYKHGIVLTMDQTEAMGVDAPVLLPTAVYVPIEFR